MDKVIEWLLESDPWVEYRTRTDLLGQPESDSDVLDAKERMRAHPLITKLLGEIGEWPGEPFSSHKSAGLLMHKLTFLADIGLKTDVPEIADVVGKIQMHTDEGVPQVLGKISTNHGGTGEDLFGWALCDAPLMLYSLLKFDKGNKEAMKGYEKLKALARVGWPCIVSPELGNFRGPGKKGETCPYATLVMLKAMTAAGDTECSEACEGLMFLLRLWQNSREQHPYIFYMGTDFRKLKAPFVWYDILHVADVLTNFKIHLKDAPLVDMVGLIKSKAGNDGKYTAESEWKAWKAFEFGQKKQPSPWITFLVLRILKRMK